MAWPHSGCGGALVGKGRANDVRQMKSLAGVRGEDREAAASLPLWAQPRGREGGV